ncbi:glycosyltransferase [soil metagenome]
MNNNKKFNNTNHRPRILVTPLNWGLGHSTRCIPVIDLLINSDCEVVIGADGAALQLLQNHFPQLQFFTAPSYKITYSTGKFFFKLKILLQVPKIVAGIRKEKYWLKKIVREQNIDAVISDNRFGMYHEKIPCAYLTHQLLIESGYKLTNTIIQWLHYRVIQLFTYCWVPDAKANGLAGMLSHPAKLPPNVRYIGPLSRFENRVVQKKYDLLFILSGTEPQRSILENKICSQIKNLEKQILIVRGITDNTSALSILNPQVSIINYASAEELNTFIEASEWIISRAGYTTVMDLAKLKKKAILIPTPGQTEQEYLSKYLMERQMFYGVSQKKFNIHADLKNAATFPFRFHQLSFDKYVDAVTEFVVSLRTEKHSN